MPPRRPEEQITLPRSFAADQQAAAVELGRALGSAAEVMERAETALAQAAADRADALQIARGLAVQLDRATRKLDAHPTMPPPPLPMDPKAAVAHAIAGWAASKSGQISLSFLIAAVAALLASLAGWIGYDGPLPLPGSSQ